MGAYYTDGNKNVTQANTGFYQNSKIGGYFGDGKGGSTTVLGGPVDVVLPVVYTGNLNAGNPNLFGTGSAKYIAKNNTIVLPSGLFYFPLSMTDTAGAVLFYIDCSKINKHYISATGIPQYNGSSFLDVYQYNSNIYFKFDMVANDYPGGWPNTTYLSTTQYWGVYLPNDIVMSVW